MLEEGDCVGANELDAILHEFVEARRLEAQQRWRHLASVHDIVKEMSERVAGFANAEDPITREKLVSLHHAEQIENDFDSLWICNLVTCTNHALQLAILPDGKIAVSRDSGSTVYFDEVASENGAIVFQGETTRRQLADMLADFLRFAFSKDAL